MTTAPAATNTATHRTFNFSAGPAILPEPVLHQAQQDIWDIHNSGIGILEHSHRGKVFDRVLQETEDAIRQVTNIPDTHAVFCMQGGATSQCYLVPANFLPDGKTADYFRTGKWAKDSIKEARFYGNAHVCYDGEPHNFSHLPTDNEVNYSDNPTYVQYTSNNTIMGTQWHRTPKTPNNAPLICDASSDIFSKPINVADFGLIYAGAQKNLGPSGTVLVIARKDLIENPVRELPMMQSYKLFADNHSRPNTPPTFGIYLMGLVFKWIVDEGGLEEMERRNKAKADLIYNAIADNSGFYTPHADPESRSLMNITFKCPTPELDSRFMQDAAKENMDGLKGHRSIGGMRASMYNAFPHAGAEALTSFMKDFARKNG